MKIQNNISLLNNEDYLKSQKDKSVGDSFEKALEMAKLNEDDEKLKEACQEMESFFIQYLYKTMRESTKMGEGIIPKGQHEEIFEDMLIEEHSKDASKAGGIGLADMLYKQLSREYASEQYKLATSIKSPLDK